MKEKQPPTATGIQIVHALQRDGWIVVRKEGSHVRLQKHTASEPLKLTIPAHRPVKRTTLAHILKQASLSVDDFIRLA
jgi:predicted RNA binding protein YcfA (HicA-like mRNA interferase family)